MHEVIWFHNVKQCKATFYESNNDPRKLRESKFLTHLSPRKKTSRKTHDAKGRRNRMRKRCIWIDQKWRWVLPQFRCSVWHHTIVSLPSGRLVREQTSHCIRDLNALRAEAEQWLNRSGFWTTFSSEALWAANCPPFAVWKNHWLISKVSRPAKPMALWKVMLMKSEVELDRHLPDTGGGLGLLW